ncbi:ATP-grasp domain-containing protein [Microcoleus sp. T3B2]|uniref:ATP-grasp domain-containing protein n=1 Tax=Microcoleus sp. T3B2 TaxID=3055426 RepID=UPI002FD44568
MYKVLIFPGGTEIGLEINQALHLCPEIQLFSAGIDTSNHAPYVFKNHFIIPSIYTNNWIEKLNEIIAQYAIDYIFPAYDDVIVALAKNAEKLRAKIISSPLETCLVTRSKLKTYKLLTGIIPVPNIYDYSHQINSYPVFIKPEAGQGSQRAVLVENKASLDHLLQKHQDYIITEYLPGEEYTIDCFSDREQGLIFCHARQRIRIKNGISMNCCFVSHKDDIIFAEYANKICQKIDFYGAWFFQLKKDCYGVLKLLEIAPRIAGTMALNRVLGVNFPLLSLYEQERISIEILFNKTHVEIDRALVNRYSHKIDYKTVYLELDNTLIVENKINPQLIKFIYQCINADIELILLTKHQSDLQTTLKKYRLAGVFDKIIPLAEAAKKSDHITDDKAILIDADIRERQEVFSKLGILTFDCSMIEMLLDERS